MFICYELGTGATSEVGKYLPRAANIWHTKGMRIILLLPLVARCLETIDVSIWRIFVCHQDDGCENSNGSVYVGRYCGLSESGLCVSVNCVESTFL